MGSDPCLVSYFFSVFIAQNSCYFSFKEKNLLWIFDISKVLLNERFELGDPKKIWLNVIKYLIIFLNNNQS